MYWHLLKNVTNPKCVCVCRKLQFILAGKKASIFYNDQCKSSDIDVLIIDCFDESLGSRIPGIFNHWLHKTWCNYLELLK